MRRSRHRLSFQADGYAVLQRRKRIPDQTGTADEPSGKSRDRLAGTLTHMVHRRSSGRNHLGCGMNLEFCEQLFLVGVDRSRSNMQTRGDLLRGKSRHEKLAHLLFPRCEVYLFPLNDGIGPLTNAESLSSNLTRRISQPAYQIFRSVPAKRVGNESLPPKREEGHGMHRRATGPPCIIEAPSHNERCERNTRPPRVALYHKR